MFDRQDKRGAGGLRLAAIRMLVFAGGICGSSLAIAGPPVAPAPPYVYVARAHLVEVERFFVDRATVELPGAGVRAFQAPAGDDLGTERFDIRWYANPPGIPPGVVILLEAIHARSKKVKNYTVRLSGKSEGHLRSLLQIPPETVRQAGRVERWRVRIIWRGRLLATQTSDNWEG